MGARALDHVHIPYRTIMSTVTYYFTSVSGNMALKKNQQRIESVLTSKNIPIDAIDIASTPGAKEKMRELSKNATALPPQLFLGEKYLGDFEKFEEALECDAL